MTPSSRTSPASPSPLPDPSTARVISSKPCSRHGAPSACRRTEDCPAWHERSQRRTAARADVPWNCSSRCGSARVRMRKQCPPPLAYAAGPSPQKAQGSAGAFHQAFLVTLPARKRSPAFIRRPLLSSATPLVPRHTSRPSRTSTIAPGTPASTTESNTPWRAAHWPVRSGVADPSMPFELDVAASTGAAAGARTAAASSAATTTVLPDASMGHPRPFSVRADAPSSYGALHCPIMIKGDSCGVHRIVDGRPATAGRNLRAERADGRSAPQTAPRPA